MDYIESMNVMTGGLFRARCGNRFGGILDVVTKSGFTLRNRASVTLGTGTAQRHNVGLEFGGHLERTAYYLNLSWFHVGSISEPAVAASPSTTPGAASAVSGSWISGQRRATTSSSC